MYGNVALQIAGSNCTAGGDGDRLCARVIDAIFDPSVRWRSDGARDGRWIQINFNDSYVVEVIRFMQRTYSLRCAKDITIAMDGHQPPLEVSKDEPVPALSSGDHLKTL